MTLKDVFQEHLKAGQQGQLVIKFAEDLHLCKILVEDGTAVHISHGRTNPADILAALTGKTVEWVNFIAGYPVRKKLDFPLHESLLKAAEPADSVRTPAATPQPATAPATATQPSPAANEPSVAAEQVVAAIEGLIEEIGPLGTILAEQAADSINYSNGTPMPATSYEQFIQSLAKEVPEQQRSAYLEQFKR